MSVTTLEPPSPEAHITQLFPYNNFPACNPTACILIFCSRNPSNWFPPLQQTLPVSWFGPPHWPWRTSGPGGTARLAHGVPSLHCLLRTSLAHCFLLTHACHHCHHRVRPLTSTFSPQQKQRSLQGPPLIEFTLGNPHPRECLFKNTSMTYALLMNIVD